MQGYGDFSPQNASIDHPGFQGNYLRSTSLKNGIFGPDCQPAGAMMSQVELKVQWKAVLFLQVWLHVLVEPKLPVPVEQAGPLLVQPEVHAQVQQPELSVLVEPEAPLLLEPEVLLPVLDNPLLV
jgi:hypothetical protein